jgi:hypothetical protein
MFFYHAVTLTKKQHMPEEFFSELHKAAIEWARSGYPVFPCIPGDKKPAIAGGFLKATTDENIINGWWRENPNYNIATEPERNGFCVIDVEYNGIVNWEKLERENGVTETYTVRTPRGGLHLYFEGSLPATAKGLFNGYPIDTRGRGSYVLLEPSVVGGNKYSTLKDIEMKPLPEWVKKRVDDRKHEKQAAPADVELDTPTSISAAKDFLARHAPPTVGERNVKTFPMACQLKDLGLSRDTMIELLSPWSGLDDEELTTTVESAIKNGQNAVGCDARRTWAEAFEGIEIPPEPKPKAGYYDCEDDDAMDCTPVATWIFPEVLPERGSVLFYGPTKQYKSFLLIDLALALATGKEGWGIKPTKQGPVIYSALEGREALKRDRRPAWRMARGIEGKTEFYVNRAPMIKQPGACDAYIAAVEKRLAGKRPAAIFLETASKMMVGLDPTRDVPLLVSFIDRLVEHFHCVVVISHHTGNEDKGPKDSSTYMQAFDTVISVRSPAKLVAEARIEKHKDAAEPTHPFTFKGVRMLDISLVFNRTTAEEHETLVPAEEKKSRVNKVNIYSETNIGAALRELKAIGRDEAVATNVLAAKLMPSLDSESLEERQVKVKEAAKKLSTLSKNLLETYCTLGTDGKPLWHMPESTR